MAPFAHGIPVQVSLQKQLVSVSLQMFTTLQDECLHGSCQLDHNPFSTGSNYM